MLTEQEIAEICYAALNVLYDHEAAVAHTYRELPGSRRAAVLESVRLARNGLTPGEVHDLRVQRLIQLGWTYGPVRDDPARVAPFICPWGKLDGNTRRAARIFHVLILALSVEDFDSRPSHPLAYL